MCKETGVSNPFASYSSCEGMVEGRVLCRSQSRCSLVSFKSWWNALARKHHWHKRGCKWHGVWQKLLAWQEQLLRPQNLTTEAWLLRPNHLAVLASKGLSLREKNGSRGLLGVRLWKTPWNLLGYDFRPAKDKGCPPTICIVVIGDVP